jgi:hypothetical protein
MDREIDRGRLGLGFYREFWKLNSSGGAGIEEWRERSVRGNFGFCWSKRERT